MFGGRFQWQGGLDCAGFVCLVFDRIGVDVDPGHDLIYTNAERIRQYWTPVLDPLPGDLVFFERTYPTTGASHLGIVVDFDKRIMLDDHRRSPTAGPGWTDYGAPWWQSRLLGFGRVIR